MNTHRPTTAPARSGASARPASCATVTTSSERARIYEFGASAKRAASARPARLHVLCVGVARYEDELYAAQQTRDVREQAEIQSSQTLGNLMDDWLAEKRRRVEQNTLREDTYDTLFYKANGEAGYKAQWGKRPVATITAKENADRFTVGILALVAQRERELIGERTRSGLAAAKSKGVKLGTPNPEKAVAAMVTANKAATVKFASKVFPIIEEIKNAGVKTLGGICECLNRRGISTRNGKNWYPATVRNILKLQNAYE